MGGSVATGSRAPIGEKDADHDPARSHRQVDLLELVEHRFAFEELDETLDAVRGCRAAPRWPVEQADEHGAA